MVIADSGGRASVYLDPGTYDYLITSATPAAFDDVNGATMATSSDTLAWNHTATGTGRLVLVSVAWIDPLDSETLDSVTYGGFAMTRIGSTNKVELFALVDPPTGSKEVKVAWSDGTRKGVVAASNSFTDADQETTFGVVRSATGSGTSATVNVIDTLVNGLVLTALGVTPISSSMTATVDGGSTSRWNDIVGVIIDVTRTMGAGATKPSAGGGTVATSWTLSSSQLWGAIGVELLPPGTRLVIDQTGEACDCPTFGLNALHYTSLQDAVDALPPLGGVIYLPAGTYKQKVGLLIAKPNVTLIGEGLTTVITPEDPVNLPLDLITITAGNVRLIRIAVDGRATSRDLVDGTCGIVFRGYTGPLAPHRLVLHCYLENVVATGCSRYGVLMVDTILLTAIDCQFVANQGGGLRIQGSIHGTCDALRFIGCGISSNGGIGIDVGDPLEPPDTLGTGINGITVLGCTIQSNLGNSIGDDLALVGAAVNVNYSYKCEIIACYFEVPPEGCEQYIRIADSPNVSVRDCLFSGNIADHENGPERAIAFIKSNFAFAANNVMNGFKTEIINFDSDSRDCVELCNRDLNATTVPRIVGSDRVVGFSQQSIVLPRFANDGARPTAASLRPGSMIWVISPTSPTTNLQVSNGTSWVQP